MKKWFSENILSSNKKSLLLVGLSAFFILSIYQIILLVNGTYFNSNSDDVLQYSVILSEYVENLKCGNINFFKFNNSFGASVFADAYYVPIDVFSFLTFIFSFIMNPLLAFSCVELTKVLLGVIVFAIFLQRNKFNNKIVLFVSLIYFCSGGSWCFSVFPTYFSLFFYLPLSLLVVRLFCEGRKWILPIYSFVLILHNFYNAYSLFIFMLFVYIVIIIRDEYRGFGNLVKKAFCFGLHIVLGVIMGLFLLLPCVLYIINYSTRMINDFEVVFKLDVYMKMIYRLFVFESGTINLAETMALEGFYHQSHFSYYVGFLGLYLISFLFMLKDRTSKIYKWSIIVIVIMMCIPIFSMIYSAAMVAYTRWFTYINIILLYYLAYVIDVIDLKSFSKKDSFKVIMWITCLFVIVFTYNVISFIVASSKNEAYYSYCFVMLIIFGIIAVSYLIFVLVKQKTLIFSLFVVEMIFALAINFSVPFSTSNIEVIKEVEKINKTIDNMEMDGNLERVYFTNPVSSFNNNRYTNNLTNEITFHSFLPYYLSEFEDLYSSDSKVALVLSNLNNFSLNSKRIIDYKYVVVDKNEDYGFDYLKKYYEDDEVIIYENSDYNSFYVYENYYEQSQVLDARGENEDFLHFSKMLFDGVVLGGENYNLNKNDFTYSNSKSKKFDFHYKTSLVESNGEYIEHVDFKQEYDGAVYVRGDDLDRLKDVYIEDDSKRKKCDFLYDVFVCEFENGFDNIIFNSSESLENLDYLIVVEHEDKMYVYKEMSDMFGLDYINYYYEKRENEVKVVDEKGNIRTCTQDYCSLYNFDVKYILKNFSLDGYAKNDYEMNLLYQTGLLSEYNQKNDEKYASDKSLSYKGSTINVKYTRLSDSSNDQVIVLPITYSDEWKCDNENYELVKANGGFLGIVVKNGIKNVDVSITFKPSGVKIGLIGSIIGFCSYGLYIGFLYYRKKKVRVNENI